MFEKETLSKRQGSSVRGILENIVMSYDLNALWEVRMALEALGWVEA